VEIWCARQDSNPGQNVERVKAFIGRDLEYPAGIGDQETAQQLEGPERSPGGAQACFTGAG
jgi:hypothetical protein